MRLRKAQLVAEAVTVLCPYCSADQPSPRNGSLFWTPEDFKAEKTRATCCSCDEEFHLHFENKVQFNTK